MNLYTYIITTVDRFENFSTIRIDTEDDYLMTVRQEGSDPNRPWGDTISIGGTVLQFMNESVVIIQKKLPGTPGLRQSHILFTGKGF